MNRALPILWAVDVNQVCGYALADQAPECNPSLLRPRPSPATDRVDQAGEWRNIDAGAPTMRNWIYRALPRLISGQRRAPWRFEHPTMRVAQSDDGGVEFSPLAL